MARTIPLLGIALLACSQLRTNTAYTRQPAPARIAVAPLRSEADEKVFAEGLVADPRCAIVPGIRAKVSADERLQRRLQRDINGSEDVAPLRRAFAPATLLLLPAGLEVRQTLWHTMTGKIGYSLYDLRDGAFVLENEQALSTKTNPRLDTGATDAAALAEMLRALGRAACADVVAHALASP
jgi:hypothetical protein